MSRKDIIEKLKKDKKIKTDPKESTEITEEIEKNGLGDYETGSLALSEKMRIVKQVTNLIFLAGKKLTIYDSLTNEIDEVFTKMINEGTNHNNFWRTFETSILRSLLTGEAGIRVMGGITSPKIYVVDSLTLAYDLMNSNEIFFLNATFRTIRGSLANVIVDFYDANTKILTSSKSIQFKTDGARYSRNEEEKVKYMPYVILHPTLNQHNEPVDLFWYVSPWFEMYDRAYRQFNTRLKKSNLYILPNKRLFGGVNNKIGWFKDLFNDSVIPLKDQTLGMENNEAFSLIDPDQNNTKIVWDNMEALRKAIWDEIGIQDIQFQGSYQKNDREVDMLKQKEYNLIKRLTTYFGNKAEEVIDLLIPEGYHSEVIIEGDKINNEELELEKTKEKAKTGSITPEQEKDEMEKSNENTNTK